VIALGLHRGVVAVREQWDAATDGTAEMDERVDIDDHRYVACSAASSCL